MIISYLYSLGFSLILTADTKPYCDGHDWNGCYNHTTKQIVINVNSPQFKRTFWHEVGHALTWEDDELRSLCLENYAGQFKNRPLEEFMADAYANYRLGNKHLKEQHPLIYKHFNNTTSSPIGSQVFFVFPICIIGAICIAV
jgi:hypothetical protein